jgi:hypothetical protein
MSGFDSAGFMDLKVTVLPIAGNDNYVLELQQMNESTLLPCDVLIVLFSGRELPTAWADPGQPVWVPVSAKKSGLSGQEILELFHNPQPWLRITTKK